MDGRIVVTFSPPIDILGNPVDRGGQSLDPRGRVVDVRRYVTRAGEPVHDEQRDHEYTSELAQRIADAFAADNCVMSTNVVAWVLFRMLRRDNPELDLYRLLRTGGRASAFPLQRVQSETEALLARLRARERGPRLGADLQGRDARAVVDDALRHFSVYHRRAAAVRRNDEVVHEDRNLLLFYANRLDGYGLERA
jgi:glycerol-3-phosphate O-acyltransferase